MITLRQPLYFSEVGKKENQEDFLFPANPSPSARVFILCDGMGGHLRGEIASSTVATALGMELQQIPGQEFTPRLFGSALTAAYDALETIENASDSGRKPGTTMTALCLNGNSFLAAHIGDSRIYHIRPALYREYAPEAAILYRSQDHSLVNDLVRAGQITPEEARTHPRRNIITRAMQPGLTRRFDATIFQSDDIKAGDYFFLCSDGVLEHVSDAVLCKTLSDMVLSDSEKLQALKHECDKGTRDNYSCYLIPVDSCAESSHSRYRTPIIALTSLIAAAGIGLATYHTGVFHTAPDTDSCDTAVTVADTTVTDTLIPDTPISDTLPADTVTQTMAGPAGQTAGTPTIKPPETDTVTPGIQLKTNTPGQDINTPVEKLPAQTLKPNASGPDSGTTSVVPSKPHKSAPGNVPPPAPKKKHNPKPLF